MFATKVSEGFQRPNADYESSIDIKYGKLVERLVDMKLLPVDWPQKIRVIQANAAAAQKKLAAAVWREVNPSGELPLDYMACKAIRDILKRSADTTIFGGLAGEAGVWDKLVTAYERQNVWLGEASLRMQRSVDYELPFLKKSAAQCDAQLLALRHRHEECCKAAAAAAATYRHECAALGVPGTDLASEVPALPRSLPRHLSAVRDALQSPDVAAAVQLYAAFAAHAHGGTVAALPVLDEFRAGKTTFTEADRDTFQGLSGAPEGGEAAAATPVPDVELDWGTLDGRGDGEGAAGGDAAAIDWGILLEVDDHADQAAARPQPAAAEALGQGDDRVDGGESSSAAAEPLVMVDWDIVMDAEGEALADAGQDAGAGAGELAEEGVEEHPQEVMRLAYDSRFRTALVTELHELEAFLAQFEAGLQAGSSSLVHLPLPDDLLHVSAPAAHSMHSVVAAALDGVGAAHVRKLFLIASSRKYAQRLVRDLRLRSGQESKMQVTAADVLHRQQELQRQLMGIAPKQNELAQHTRRLRTCTADHVSQLLKRKVEITGEISIWV